MNHIGKKKYKQISTLYLSNIINVFLGVGISVVNTRLLGAYEYGAYRYSINLFEMVSTFVLFGFFYSGSRLLAKSGDSQIDVQRAIIGSLMIIVCIESLISIVIIMSIVRFNIISLNDYIREIILLTSPLFLVFPLKNCIENILMGMNRIIQLSYIRLLPRLFYLVILTILAYKISVHAKSALFIYLISMISVFLLTISTLKPNILDAKNHLKRIYNENMKTGLPIYLSTIANTGTGYLAAISINEYIDVESVGYFSLARAVAAPLVLLSSSIGTTLFRSFVNSDYINRKLQVFNFAICFVSIILFLLIIKPIFFFIYSKEFEPALRIVYFLSFAALLRGIGDLYNRFLGAHGKGKTLLMNGIIISIINIVGYIVLVKYFFLKGAIATKIISDSFYCVTMFFSYYTFIKKRSIKDPQYLGLSNEL